MPKKTPAKNKPAKYQGPLVRITISHDWPERITRGQLDVLCAAIDELGKLHTAVEVIAYCKNARDGRRLVSFHRQFESRVTLIDSTPH